MPDLPLPDQEGSDVSSPFAKKKSPGDELLENNAPYGLNKVGKSKSLTTSKTIQSTKVPPIKGKEISKTTAPKVGSGLQSKQVAGQGFKADKLGPPKVGLSSDTMAGGVKKLGLSKMKSSTLGRVGGTVGELKSMGKVGIASRSVGKVGLVSKSLGKATLGPSKSMGKSMVGGVKKIVKAPNKFESKSLGGIGIGKAGESRIRKLDLKSGTFLSGMKKGNTVGESSETPGVNKSEDVPSGSEPKPFGSAPGKTATKIGTPSAVGLKGAESETGTVLPSQKNEGGGEVAPVKKFEPKAVGFGSKISAPVKKFEPKPFGSAPGKAAAKIGPPSAVGLKGAEAETGSFLSSQKREGDNPDKLMKKFEPKPSGFGSKISAPVKKFDPKPFAAALGKETKIGPSGPLNEVESKANTTPKGNGVDLDIAVGGVEKIGSKSIVSKSFGVKMTPYRKIETKQANQSDNAKGGDLRAKGDELSAEGGMQVAKGAEAKPYVSSFTSNTVKSVTEVKSATLGGRKSLDYLGGAPKKSAGDKTPTKNEIPAKGVETTSGETSFSTPLGKKELPDISKLKSKLPGGSKLPVKSIVPPFPSTEVGDSEFKASSTSDDESEQASTSSSIASSQAQAPFKKGLPFMKKSSQIIDLKSDTESPTKKT